MIELQLFHDDEIGRFFLCDPEQFQSPIYVCQDEWACGGDDPEEDIASIDDLANCTIEVLFWS